MKKILAIGVAVVGFMAAPCLFAGEEQRFTKKDNTTLGTIDTGGNVVYIASVTASAFFGDGSNLTGWDEGVGPTYTRFTPTATEAENSWYNWNSITLNSSATAVSLIGVSGSVKGLFVRRTGTLYSRDIIALVMVNGSSTTFTLTLPQYSSGTFSNTSDSLVVYSTDTICLAFTSTGAWSTASSLTLYIALGVPTKGMKGDTGTQGPAGDVSWPIVGTTSNKYISIGSSVTASGVFAAQAIVSGNIGIGTTDPTLSLDVAGVTGKWVSSDGRACDVVRYTNHSGASMSSGTAVVMDNVSLAVTTAPTTGDLADMPAGASQDASCADNGLCWIGYGGICAWKTATTTTATLQQICYTGGAGAQNGVVQCSSTVTLSNHNGEVGHTTKVTGVAGDVVLLNTHFN